MFGVFTVALSIMLLRFTRARRVARDQRLVGLQPPSAPTIIGW
jgi:hypothetical protein